MKRANRDSGGLDTKKTHSDQTTITVTMKSATDTAFQVAARSTHFQNHSEREAEVRSQSEREGGREGGRERAVISQECNCTDSRTVDQFEYPAVLFSTGFVISVGGLLVGYIVLVFNGSFYGAQIGRASCRERV